MKAQLTLLTILLLFSQEIYAQPSTYRSENIIRITADDTLHNNVMLTGDRVEIMGYLDDDLYSASRSFLLDGNINDDAFVAGQMVSIYGHVGGLLMSAGETVVIDGTVEGDIFAVGRDVTIGEQASIHGNAFVAGATVVMEGGTIDGILRTAGGELELNGIVNGSTEIYSDNVTFGENYKSTYGTNITSTESIHRENLGVIPPDLTLNTEEVDIWGIILFQLWFFVSMLVTGLILIRLFQKTAVDMSKFATERFWKNTGWGFLTFIAVPIAVIILAVILITIPLSILLSITYMIALFISYILVAMSLGVMSIIYFTGEAQTSTYYYGLVLGMIYIAILTNLPFVGGILNAILLLFGLGSLVHYLWKLSESTRQAETIYNTNVESVQ